MSLLSCHQGAGEAFPRPFAGVDEAGRGCLAGPVVAAAVILPPGFDLPGLGDSKKLSERRRLALEPAIKAQAAAWALGVVWPADIDRMDILRATFAAMSNAVARLRVRPVFVAVDGDKTVPGLGPPQRAVIGGDAKIPEISAASVLAKTFRDRLMTALARRYPGYGLEVHKGYGTRAHMQALERLGPCPQHRRTFQGVRPRARAREDSLCLPGI
ncbi:ribonuclease HII [Desulfocurvus sp.]|jgi:ribonuclease HII|uniref:ribonuclease HII n=1 Tax=Desulfocurvus sp. TaxID=2871698 RepID=UPI0025BC34BA|nr:ribonuclease HII [Desulfocurvus sp.]MCK9240290.1 ribonuclease HII [Desulfocurvus sp.]